MRHKLVKSMSQFGPSLISERKSETDVGIGSEISHRQDLTSLVTANARRVEEALRVIEELSKLPDLSSALPTKDFEAARFNIYTLQRELLSRLTRRHNIEQLHGLYVIIDSQTLDFKGEVDVARKVIKGGVKVIQLRDKQRSRGDLLTLARGLSDLCHRTNTLFIVNDYLDIALASDADGIHIGQDDLPLAAIRKQLPVDRIVGISAATVALARKAESEGADYVAVGSLYSSPTKPKAKVIGLKRLSAIRKAISIPIVAIGGINRQNIGDVMAAGADAAAVISAVLNEEDRESAARQLVKEIEKEKGHRKSRSSG
jgi:thiamine-phosphate pyrophosphorylase